jgi:hypothetical protein
MERFQLLRVLHLNHLLAFFGLDHESKISLHRNPFDPSRKTTSIIRG